MSKIQELRDLGDAELVGRLDSNKEELFNLRFQLATGQLDNPMRIKAVRHEVARILTVLRQRELEAELESFEAALVGGEVAMEGSRGEAEAPEGGSAKRGLLRKNKEIQ
jgi:large subunit ribosomal protein L29